MPGPKIRRWPTCCSATRTTIVRQPLADAELPGFPTVRVFRKCDTRGHRRSRLSSAIERLAALRLRALSRPALDSAVTRATSAQRPRSSIPMNQDRSKQRPKASEPRQRALKDANVPAPKPAKPEAMHRAEAQLPMELIDEYEAEQRGRSTVSPGSSQTTASSQAPQLTSPAPTA